MMRCPVCQHEEISDIHVVCPECGTELIEFRLIGVLDEQYRDVLKERVALEGELAIARQSIKRHQGRAFRLLLLSGILAALCGFLWFCKQRPVVQHVQQVVRPDSLDYYKAALESYRLRSPKEIRYVIRKDDRLEKIGLLFFNSKTAGYKIGEDNGIDDKSERRRMIPGDTLTIRFW